MIDHLSYSSINMYLTCARSWKFRYVEKPETPTAINLFFGSAFHHAVENYINARSLEKEANLLDCWNGAWNFKMEQEGNQVEWGTETPEQHYNEGIRMLSNESILYNLNTIQAMINKGGDPVLEQRVELTVPGVPMPVIGYIDIVTRDGTPGDFKTSSRKWSDDKASSELQPVFYLAALNQLGVQPTGWFRHYIFVKTKEPQFQMLEHKHELGEMIFLFSLIQNVWKAIEAEAFPENPTGWKCCPQWCEFWHLCRGRYG